jgi:hypothetical protein
MKKKENKIILTQALKGHLDENAPFFESPNNSSI